MAVMRMSRFIPSSRRFPLYSSLAAEVLQSRFFQLLQLLSLFSVSLAAVLTLFATSTAWFWIVPTVILKAAPLFAAWIAVVFHRKANVRVRYNAYPSAFAEIIGILFRSPRFIIAIAVYAGSLTAFYTAYGWAWTDSNVYVGSEGTFRKLNEKYLYWKLLNAIQCIVFVSWYFVNDMERLKFELDEVHAGPQRRIAKKVGQIGTISLLTAVSLTIGAPILYLAFRRAIWSIGLTSLRLIYDLPLTGYSGSPIGLKTLWSTFFSSLILFFGWHFANFAFEVYMTLGPSHRGELISAKSNDSNGTLVTGLQAKQKQLIRMLAFQELAFIAYTKSERRVSIFADIDRKVSIWSLIKIECIALLDEIINPIEKLYTKIDSKSDTAKQLSSIKPTPAVNSELKYIPLKSSSNIFTSQQNKSFIDNLQDPKSQTSHNVVSILQKVQKRYESFVSTNMAELQALLQSNVLYPLRFTVQRRSHQLISNPSLTTTGVLALSQLLCMSISEDPYGTVYKSVPEILSKLVAASLALQKFMESPPIHWSNPDEKQQGAARAAIEDAARVQEAVDSAFDEIVEKFYEYLPGMELDSKVVDVIESRLIE